MFVVAATKLQALICFTDRAGCLTKMRPGDTLALELDSETGKVFVYERFVAHHTYLGALGSQISFDPEYTSAIVDNPLLGTIRIRFYPQESCGCIRNLGGFHVLRCRTHPAPESRPEWEGYGERGISDDPTREERSIYEQITQ